MRRLPNARRSPRAQKTEVPAARCVRLFYASNFPEGLTAVDFNHVQQLFGYLRACMRALDHAPGVNLAVPETGRFGSSPNPARQLVREVLTLAENYAFDRSTEKHLESKLPAEAEPIPPVLTLAEIARCFGLKGEAAR